MSSQARISAKQGGENAEAAIIQTVSELEYLDDIEDVHADARATTVIVPSPELPTVALPVVAIGTLVEVKSAMVVYGESQTRGCYYLRQQQHSHLLEKGPIYLFAVCAPTPARPVIAMKLVPATIVELVDDVELVHHPDPTTIPLEVGDQVDDADATLADFAGDA